ncbi:MAG TPA: hypothetical protein VHX65_19950 [Pirellulales bacterium]|nr:hypothetical protein [Pirellulales bacterium]
MPSNSKTADPRSTPWKVSVKASDAGRDRIMFAMQTDAEIIVALIQKVAELEEWLSAERARREAVDDRLRDARDELRRQSAEMAEMQKGNGHLRGRIAELESRAKPDTRAGSAEF